MAPGQSDLVNTRAHFYFTFYCLKLSSFKLRGVCEADACYEDCSFRIEAAGADSDNDLVQTPGESAKLS